METREPVQQELPLPLPESTASEEPAQPATSFPPIIGTAVIVLPLG